MAKTTQIDDLDRDLIRTPLHENLLGNSPAMKEVISLLQRLAKSDLTVLISGESGTGKDIAARTLHELSPRFGKPFIKVNCPAIPESILESELFGYERGAFTGARTSKPGRFELANNGSIFLDEVAETSYTVQSKLLQVLDGEPFLRIGGTTPVKTDVRIIAATNVSLEDAVRQVRVREDIFFRLSEVIIRMPALRERIDDLPLLAEHFNYNFTKKLGKPYEPISGDIIDEMREQEWEGNIRELAGRVKKYVASRNPQLLLQSEKAGRPETNGPRSSSEVNALTASKMDAARPEAGRSEAKAPDDGLYSAPAVDGGAEPSQVRKTPEPEEAPSRRKFVPLKEATRRAVESTERALIEEALRHTLWNRRKAAKLLDISYSSLLRRIDAYNIGKTDTE